MPFSITGHTQDDGTLAETRLQAGSACVLAMKWTALGHRVRIIDNAGRQYDLNAFKRAVTEQKAKSRPF